MNKKSPVDILLLFTCCLCGILIISGFRTLQERQAVRNRDVPFLLITGIAQDAGYPQAGCYGSCCQPAQEDHLLSRYPVSLSLVAPGGSWWLFEATPDIKYQIADTWKLLPIQNPTLPEGIFLTHAHIGHYSGLMHLGREVIGARGQTVYALPRMQSFLQENGPWDQLVKIKNIQIRPIKFQEPVFLGEDLDVVAIQVPHRDEYSETAGFHIRGPNRSALFIPDIDKWSVWDDDLAEWIEQVDYALIDATFFDGNELPGRNMDDIPHPFVTETMELLKGLQAHDRQKVHFIHLNHTNPLLKPGSDAVKQVMQSGFRVAAQGQILEL